MDELWQTYAIIKFKKGGKVRIDNVTEVLRRCRSILLCTKSHKILIPFSKADSVLVITDKVDLDGCAVTEIEQYSKYKE